MKKLLILLVFIGYSVVSFGQQDSVFVIAGTVWDNKTGEAIEKATVFLIKDNVKIDSTFSNKAGKYQFEIFEEGCYDLRSEIINYLSKINDKCYQFKKGELATYNFYLTYYNYGKLVYYPPRIDTFLMKIVIQDENGQPISDVQIDVHDYFKPNDYTKIYTYLGDSLIFKVSPNITFEMTVTKTGYQETERVFIFPSQMTCSQNYVETKAEYDAIVKAIKEREFDREMIVTLKKEN